MDLMFCGYTTTILYLECPIGPYFFFVFRASIVQKKIIYFQDEGSLTIRLCEKGNDSCLSWSSSLLPIPLTTEYGAKLYHASFYFMPVQHLPVSMCHFFKIMPREADRKALRASPGSLCWNILLCFTTELHFSLRVAGHTLLSKIPFVTMPPVCLNIAFAFGDWTLLFLKMLIQTSAQKNPLLTWQNSECLFFVFWDGILTRFLLFLRIILLVY